MNWKIKFSSQAEHYYNRLNKVVRKRIKIHLNSIAECENPVIHTQVKPLTGDLRGFFRLRVGDYRIIFALLKDSKIIAVVNIFPRGNAYKKR